MEESNLTFEEIEAAHLEGLLTDEERILRDPTTSRWLQRAIRDLDSRDALDMLRDIEMLLKLAQARRYRGGNHAFTFHSSNHSK